MKITCPKCSQELSWNYTISDLKNVDILEILFVIKCDCGYAVSYPVVPKAYDGSDEEFRKITKKARKDKMFG